MMPKITKQVIETLPVGKTLTENGIIYRKGKTGGSWWISYYVGTRRIRERVGKAGEVSKKDAVKALKSRQGDIVRGRFDVAKTEKPVLFRDFFKDYIRFASANKKSWSHDEDRGNKHLIPVFGDLPLNEITPWKIEKYKSRRSKDGVAKATINRELALLKTVFSKAVVWGKTHDNPVKRVKLYRENNTIVRYLTKDEALRLLEACSDFLRPIVLLALNTGMRKGEVFRLQWRDVNLKRGIIKIRDSKDGKDAYIPINRTVQDLLDDLPKFDDNPHVFPGMKTGAPLRDIRESFQKALRKAEIENFRFHDLRHTFASWLVMDGVDIYTVKDLLRHKSIEMTMRYAHLAPEHRKAAVERMAHLVETATDTQQAQKEEKGKVVELPESASA